MSRQMAGIAHESPMSTAFPPKPVIDPTLRAAFDHRWAGRFARPEKEILVALAMEIAEAGYECEVGEGTGKPIYMESGDYADYGALCYGMAQMMQVRGGSDLPAGFYPVYDKGAVPGGSPRRLSYGLMCRDGLALGVCIDYFAIEYSEGDRDGQVKVIVYQSPSQFMESLVSHLEGELQGVERAFSEISGSGLVPDGEALGLPKLLDRSLKNTVPSIRDRIDAALAEMAAAQSATVDNHEDAADDDGPSP